MKLVLHFFISVLYRLLKKYTCNPFWIAGYAFITDFKNKNNETVLFHGEISLFLKIIFKIGNILGFKDALNIMSHAINNSITCKHKFTLSQIS